MFDLIFYFLLSKNKNTKNVFLKKNIFVDLLKIIFIITDRVCILPKMKFLISTENKTLLFLIFDSFEKIFLIKIQSNTFSLLFFIFNKNKKPPNQIAMS